MLKLSGLITAFLILGVNFSYAQLGTLNEDESLVMNGDAQEELPEFPGGIMEMMRYVKEKIKYPQQVLDNKVIGKCYMKFLVKSDGTLDEITILKGLSSCPECDAEAIRIIKSMPKWKPGSIAGVPVALYYNLPVNFHYTGK
jgi:outer membrane biosynthesis protein TonB